MVLQHPSIYLTFFTNEQEQKDPILYSYTTAYNGFSSSLDNAQIEEVKKLDNVLGVYEDEVYHLHTTRTPEFLGIENEFGLWSGYSHGNLNVASHDVIIGVFDTGVWPESRSFDDGDMPGVPGRWKGVWNASLFGFASGTARGMAVYARVATYKVCLKTGCFGSVILAGTDRAILDVVDVLSMSLGGGSEPYYRDIIAIGVFKAMDGCFCFVFCWE
nr:subtilisin-like protease SBT1.8 [Tanacetum cinerariifolium]